MKVFLRDRNSELVDQWNYYFKDEENVTASCGDIFTDDFSIAPHMKVDAIVSPANSFGFMDGGIDCAYSEYFGWRMSENLRSKIYMEHDGELLVGQATAIDIRLSNDITPIPYLISAPTMRTPLDVSNSPNAFLAFRAALRVAKKNNFESILCPGLATSVGKMPYHKCAMQMYEAWKQLDKSAVFDQLGGAHMHNLKLKNALDMKTFREQPAEHKL